MLRINPIYKKEMKINVRGIKLPAVLIMYNILMSVIGLFAMFFTFGQKYMYGAIEYENILSVYSIMAIIEFCLILLMVPAFTAGAVSGEREKQTLEILLTTKLKPIQIVVGKLASSISTLLLLIISSIPMLSLVFTIGGIDISDMIKMIIAFVTAAILIGSIGILFSCCIKKTITATVVTYVTMTFIVLGMVVLGKVIYMLINMSLQTEVYSYNIVNETSSTGNNIFPYLLLVNPLLSLGAVISEQYGNSVFANNFISNFGKINLAVLNNWFLISISLQLFISAVLCMVSGRILNPLKKLKKKKRCI